MKKLIAKILMLALFVFPLAKSLPAEAVAPANWNATGNYVLDMEYLGGHYPHDMSLTQDSSGNLTGNGGSPVGANTYTWVITSGTVSGNTVDIAANYTATSDAVTPQTVLHINGIIAADGKISGTWSDNYQGGDRSGAINTVSGNASALGTLSAEDFGVVSYDTTLGSLKGYTAGFGVSGATLTGASSVVVKLYGVGNQLLQTNTAILSKFNADVTGTQFSSPFDVSGNFDYVTDGYWTNIRAAEYGQSVPAVKVVATVTLQNGKVVTATNTNLSGDPTTIMPPVTTLLSSISGIKYNDLNHNGYREVTEPGLAGWTIRLMSGNNTVMTTTTDANGYYTFTNLTPGTYVVRETHQTGWHRQSKNPKPIVLTSGSNVTFVNFGNRVTKNGEKEDNDATDNHQDQGGNYYTNHDNSNYAHEILKRDHPIATVTRTAK